MKNLKFIVLSLILMFCLNVNVFAATGEGIDCIYENGNEKIKIVISPNDLSSQYFSSTTTTNSVPFYPTNLLYVDNGGWFNDPYIYHMGAWYATAMQDNLAVAACPIYIENYYKDSTGPFKTYVRNVTSESSDLDVFNGMPIIKFSNQGVYYDKDGNKTEVNLSAFDSSLYQDVCLNNIHSDEVCGNDDFNNVSEIKKKKYTLVTEELPPAPTDTLSCDYRNTAGDNIVFKFNNKENNHTYELNGNTYSVYHTNRDYGFKVTSCPSTVYLSSLADNNFTMFSTPNTCPAEEKNCFYRKDIDPIYSDNASEIYPYVKFLASNESVYIKVLKTPDQNGEIVKAYLNNKTEISIDMSDDIKNKFINGQIDTLPKYILKNGNSFTFSDTKVDDNETYMYVSYLLQIVIDSDGAIEETCRNLLGDEFLTFLNDNVFKIIYIAIPILLIVLTSFDFAKVVFIDDKEGIQGAFKKFGKRAVAAVLIYFVPTILIFIVNLIGADDVEKCAQTIKNITEQQNSN